VLAWAVVGWACWEAGGAKPTLLYHRQHYSVPEPRARARARRAEHGAPLTPRRRVMWLWTGRVSRHTSPCNGSAAIHRFSLASQPCKGV